MGESFLLGPWNLSLALPCLVQISWFKYCFSVGSNILPSSVALAVELSSSPLRLQDKVGSPQGPSSWASLHLAFWARSSSLSPSPFPPRIALLRAAVAKHCKLGGFKQQEWILLVPEARSQKSRCRQGHLSLRGILPPVLLAPGGVRSQPCNCIMPVSASVVTGRSPCDGIYVSISLFL